jgi:MFS transporter, ACS family, tartrate transporter
MWRLMPILFLLYVVAYLDRINVGFGILQMRSQLGLSDRVYGRAAGIFFAGYFLFQLPSNLALERFGVRRWIAGLMLVWGAISCLMILVRGPLSFYGLRFLLGAAEAGFFPGMILYMKTWFPSAARARAVAWFMTANPVAGMIGSPLSGSLLGIHGAGLAGWQWMFLIEGVPAIMLGLAVYWALPEHPERAHWLAPEQLSWLTQKLHAERELVSGLPETAVSRQRVWRAILSPKIWLLSVVYFGVAATMYGVTLWLPTVIHSLAGLGYFWTGIVAALPFTVTAVVMVWVGVRSDRSGERRWHTAIPAFLGAAALAVAGYGGSPWVVVAGIGLGLAGAEAMVGPFWAMATGSMSGMSAAAGIAVINSLGNLGGYFGPDIVGFFRSSDGSFRGGLLAIAGAVMVSGFAALIVSRAQERA